MNVDLMPPVRVKQLELSETERSALRDRIRDDWNLDSRDMEMRNIALRRWYQKWRAVPQGSEFPSQQASNFHIPMIQWIILSRLAKQIDALLGDEAEVVVRPIGQADIERAPKIQRYMNWRVKISLKLFKKLYNYLLQKDVLGTTIGFLPWVKRTRLVKKKVFHKIQQVDEQTGLVKLVDDPSRPPEIKEVEVVDFEGPDLQVENIEDWAIPIGAESLDEADHFERRVRLNVDQLLDMVDDGTLGEGVFTDEFTLKLRRLAETGHLESTETDSGKPVRDEKKEQQGIPTSQEGRDDKLTVINWFGRWRSPDAKPKDRPQELVAFYQPDTMTLLGVSRLVDKYQDGRRPFIKSELVRDLDSPWGIGLPEFLESVNDEMDMQHNALTDASVAALSPIVFYSPSSGFPAQKFKLENGMAYPVADPSKINVLNMSNINMAPFVSLQPQLLGFAERISGVTEAELGRPFSQPNAPRTLGQQQIIQSGSNVRILMDLRLERESLREMLNRIWDMDKRFLPKPVFFRVTEADPGEFLTEEEMQGDYDFDIGPLTGASSKQQDIENLLQSFALSQSIPAIAQNPQYMMAALKKINERLGHSDLNQQLPDLSKMKPPMSPEEQNQKLLAGEDVDPNPQENFRRHIPVHQGLIDRIQDSEFSTQLQEFNPGVIGRIQAHIAEDQAALKGQLAFPRQPQPQPGQPVNGGGQGAQLGGQPGLDQLKSLLNQGGQNIA